MGIVYENGHARGVNSPNELGGYGDLMYHSPISYSVTNGYIATYSGAVVFSYNFYDIIYNNAAYYNFITIFAKINLKTTNPNKYPTLISKNTGVFSTSTTDSSSSQRIYDNYNATTHAYYEGSINRNFIIKDTCQFYQNNYTTFDETDNEWKDVYHYASNYTPEVGVIPFSLVSSSSNNYKDILSMGSAYFSIFASYGSNSSKPIPSISITGDLYCYCSK